MTTYQAGQTVAGIRTQREAASDRGIGRNSGPSSMPVSAWSEQTGSSSEREAGRAEEGVERAHS